VNAVYHSEEKQPLTHNEIAQIWQMQGELAADITLVLLYTGVRVNELLPLRCENVDPDNKFFICGSKTAAGKNRMIPIHPKIEPIIMKYMHKSQSGNVFETAKHQPIAYTNFLRNMWSKLPDGIGERYTPHATRHTLRSDLDRAGANKVAIDRILGHTSGNTGEIVYTHKNISDLMDAILLVTY